VGDFRNWLLSDAVDSAARSGGAWHHAQMAAAVSKIMRNQDLIWWPKTGGHSVSKHHWFARTSVDRLQPTTTDAAGIATQPARRLAVWQRGCGDRHQPGDGQRAQVMRLVSMMDEIIRVTASRHSRCVLTHVTNTLMP
jgi:ethanolamine ammonia-lyase large subunit